MPWLHPNPRKRFGLEIARFAVYLSIPVVAITVCSDPKNMNKLLRGFNFVEYPPAEKKLPSGDEIMRTMQEREAKRQLARVEGTRKGVQAHLAAAAAAKEVLPSEPLRQRDAPTLQAAAPNAEGSSEQTKKGWFGRWWRGGRGDAREDSGGAT